jgi:hypothetical protein
MVTGACWIMTLWWSVEHRMKESTLLGSATVASGPV